MSLRIRSFLIKEFKSNSKYFEIPLEHPKYFLPVSEANKALWGMFTSKGTEPHIRKSHVKI